ncbi:sushi domain-containing protein 2 [Erpetoichthys calabaricus]|uniref:sushi domain-containing protein 2 n=1 Tax=Erpetoichthys calabaricus TaxID=27687 RepID=UPI0022345905|nr:sushi domain-containing protein 2 [Erpetoichthys calabaricus]
MSKQPVPRRFCLAVVVLLLTSCALACGQSLCANKCGHRLETCSCHTTCESLFECCEGYRQFCLQISPYSGTVMGGTDFRILQVEFPPLGKVYCRFNSEIITTGYVDQEGKGHCISPLLYETGWIPFEVSSDGTTYNRSGSWLAVHHSKVNSQFKSILENSTKWQYYGTPGTGGSLTLKWNSSFIMESSLNVELWGYREKGHPYSDNWIPEWKYLYSLRKAVPNNASFTFFPQPAKVSSDFEVGVLRLSPSKAEDGERDVTAIWSPVHALAWHLEEIFRKNSAAWAQEKCNSWHKAEEKLPNFLSEIIDCPCTLAQARADTGRFHTDYGCDIEKGSVCTYHPGAVHCVRAIQASPKYAAGQQCCYDASGAQVLTADSIGGSTPDRGHDWGSPPFKKPPRIPGVSHWLYDVISFYYCCLWSNNCHLYFLHRPSSDCRTYKPPRVGTVFGDPHFVTFDGSNFTFNGKGEYYLLQATHKNLTIQGRTQTLFDANATRLSSVVMQEAGSDIIEVRTSGYLEVLLNQEVLSFSEQNWMDLKGVFLYSSSLNNVSVMFPSGAGVEVRETGGLMTVNILLSVDFENQTSGLLGTMNGNSSDDFVYPNGSNAELHSPKDYFNFGANWAITNESSLFTYDTEDLQKNYLFAEKHDMAFIPVFTVDDSQEDPIYEEMLKLCGLNLFCKYDTLVSRNFTVGNISKIALENYLSLTQDLEPVLSCGWIGAPTNGNKQGTTYLSGATVNFTCKSGYMLTGPTERTCQPNGMWSGSRTDCVSDNTLGIVLGSVFASLTLIVMAVFIIYHNKKQKRRSRKDSDKNGL